MRLICPKCDAQYNVADDAIPQGGRDVQCSTCGNSWFQMAKPKAMSREVSRILSTPIPSVVKTKSRDISGFDAPQTGRGDGPMHEPVTDKPRHRKVDPNIANILREEASRSHGVSDFSTAQNSTRESTPEEVAETRRRVAQMTEVEGGTRAGDSPAVAVAAAAAAAANPRAVPDLTEINAALRARSEAHDKPGLTEAEEIDAMRRRGFRRGFVLVLVLMVLIVLPYVYAQQITELMPELGGYMSTYVAVIDQLRLSLEAFVGVVSTGIANLTS